MAKNKFERAAKYTIMKRKFRKFRARKKREAIIKKAVKRILGIFNAYNVSLLNPKVEIEYYTESVKPYVLDMNGTFVVEEYLNNDDSKLKQAITAFRKVKGIKEDIFWELAEIFSHLNNFEVKTNEEKQRIQITMLDE